MNTSRTKNRKRTVRVKTINIGLIDRMFRFNLGFAILLLSVVTLQFNGAAPVWLDQTTSMPIWPYVAILGSIYPLLTALYGYDPIYALFKKDTLEAFLPRDAYTHTETVSVDEESTKTRSNNEKLAHNS